MKVMHGLIPIVHMPQFVIGIKQCDNKTMAHLVQCPHPITKAALKDSSLALKKAGDTSKIPTTVMEAIYHIWHTKSKENRYSTGKHT